MPDLDDVRGVSLATVHALTTAAMIVGVPMIIGRRFATRRATTSGVDPKPLAVIATATIVGAGLTIATQRAAWALVCLWLGIEESGARPGTRPARPAAQASGR